MAPLTIDSQLIAPPTIIFQLITVTLFCSLVEKGEKRDKEKEADMELEKRGGLMALLAGIVDNNLAKDEQSDHLDIYKKSNDGQSHVKSKGFKGKRAKSKFGCYGKRGGDRKVNGIAPQQAVQDNNPEPILALTCRCSASRKVTKTHILLCQEKMEKETALLDVRCLTKK
jgi:hypothetical protein